MIKNLTAMCVTILVGVSLLPETARRVRNYPVIFERTTHRQTYLEYIQERLEVERLLQ